MSVKQLAQMHIIDLELVTLLINFSIYAFIIYF
jgi:hypothetical protein